MADSFNTPGDPMNQLLYKTGSLDSSFRDVKEGLKDIKTQVDLIQQETRANTTELNKIKTQRKTIAAVATAGGAGGSLALKGLLLFFKSTNIDPSKIGGIF